MNVVEEIIGRLMKAGIVAEKDILAIEDFFNSKMPSDHRCFLSRAGRRAGMFMEGSDFSCDKLKTINRDAVALLSESNPEFSFTKSDFVFLMNQGYEFLFFHVDDTHATCNVFKYGEGDNMPTKVASSFTEWFSKACDDEIENYQDLRG